MSNQGLALLLVSIFSGMVGLGYAAVPLYETFCRVTGYGGTVTRAAQGHRIVADRVIKVRFAANVASGMPWHFKPVQPSQDIRVGETALAFYEAYHPGQTPSSGTATFNVTPFKAGQYFSKIDCFCFTRQTLQPGRRVDMPVTYFIDPAIMDDPALDDVGEITLSYTFFPDTEPGV